MASKHRKRPCTSMAKPWLQGERQNRRKEKGGELLKAIGQMQEQMDQLPAEIKALLLRIYPEIL